MNLVLGLFFLLLTTILGVGIPYNVCLQWMPKFVQQVFPYGKTSKGLVTTPWIKSILVPKRFVYNAYMLTSHFLHLNYPFQFTDGLHTFTCLQWCTHYWSPVSCLWHTGSIKMYLKYLKIMYIWFRITHTSLLVFPILTCIINEYFKTEGKYQHFLQVIQFHRYWLQVFSCCMLPGDGMNACLSAFSLLHPWIWHIMLQVTSIIGAVQQFWLHTPEFLISQVWSD